MYPARYARQPLTVYRRRPSPADLYLPEQLNRRLRVSSPMARDRPRHFQEWVDSEGPRSLEEATNDLIEYLENNSSEIERKIRNFRATNWTHLDIRRLVSRIFHFFDDTCFRSKLNKRVEFHGDGAYNGNPIIEEDASGKTISSLAGGAQMADVVLNSHILDDYIAARGGAAAQDLIIATVVHQLIHAYFVVVCGCQSEEKKADALLTHDEHFGAILFKLKELSGKNPLPLDFSNPIPEMARGGQGNGRLDYGRRHRYERESAFIDDRKIATECPQSVKALKEADVKDWYKNKCLKTIDPDVYVYSASSRTFDTKALSKCGPKGEWLELSHKKKLFKVPRKAVDSYSTFKKKFEDSVRKLEISSDVKKEVFEEFVRFLCEEPGDWSPGSLRTSIDLYKLALGLKFEELKEQMMDAIFKCGLQNLHHSAETVVDLLRAVYGAPNQPDGPLRDWGVGFLKTAAGAPIRVAASHPRLHNLRTHSAALKSDISRAESELGFPLAACETWYPPPAVAPTCITAPSQATTYQQAPGNYLYTAPQLPAAGTAYTTSASATTYTPIPMQHTTAIPMQHTTASPLYAGRYAPPLPLTYEQPLRMVDDPLRRGFVVEDEYYPMPGFRRWA